MAKTLAHRKYVKRVLVAMVGYVATLFLAEMLIDDRGEVIIGDGASISDYANIYSHAHAVENIHDVSLGRTVIGERARITYHAVVLSGVEVGADAMVGAMGVASKKIDPGVIAAGIPAKPIGQKKTRPQS